MLIVEEAAAEMGLHSLPHQWPPIAQNSKPGPIFLTVKNFSWQTNVLHRKKKAQILAAAANGKTFILIKLNIFGWL